jgi:hypothetical protein
MHYKVSRIALASGFAFLALSAGSALAEGGFKPGVTLNIFGSLDFATTKVGNTESDNNTGVMGGGVGYFVTESIEVGADFVYVMTTSSNVQTTTLAVLPKAQYYFGAVGGKGSIVPYVGVAGYLGSTVSDSPGSKDLSIVGFKAYVGAESFVSERTSIFGRLAYQQYEDNGNPKATYTSAPLIEFGLKTYF